MSYRQVPGIWIACVFCLVLAGCALAEPTPPPPGGLTWEDDLAIHPPPPQDLRATVEGGHVRLEWNPPSKVTVSHSYDDEIAYYRVFRRHAGSADSEPIGETKELAFVDTSPPSGQVFYRITAVHVGEYEGSRSDEVQVTLGG